MQIFGRIFDHFKDINPSTLSGAIDVIVVEDVETGELSCSPFHVRFGKLQVLKPADKKVEIEVNGRAVETGPGGIGMKIGLAGETFFVVPVEGPVPSEYQTSPLVEPIKPTVEPAKLSLSPEKSTGAASPTKSTKSVDGALTSPTLADLGEASPSLSETKGKEDGEQKKRSSVRIHLSDSEAGAEAPGSAVGAEEDWTWKWGDLPERHESAGSTVPSRSASPRSIEVLDKIIAVQRVDGSIHSPSSVDVTTTTTTSETADTPVSDDLQRMENDILESVSVTPVKQKSEQTGSPVKQTEEAKEVPVSLKEHLSKKEVVTAMYDHLVGLVGESMDDIEIELFLLPGALQILPSSIQLYERISRMVKVAEFEDFQTNPEEHLTNGIFIVHSPSSPKCCLFRAKGGIQLLIGLRLYKKMLGLERFLSLCEIQAEPVPPPVPPRSSWRQWWSSPRSQSLTAAKQPAAASVDAIGPSPLKASTTGSVSLEPSSPGKSLGPISNLVRASSSPDLISTTTGPPLDTTRVNYSKSLRLPSEELRRWGLAYGMNTIRFIVATSKHGKATCTSRLFLWRSDDKIVISDIDGTITKSDALGHLFQFVGKDWTHSGIANLFTDIARNGYRFMYLTSRAIGQADSTRDYLKGIEQDRYQLPEGPVIMSPDRFFTAVRREVIEGVPEQFKIPCLLDIRRLFTRLGSEESVDPMALTEAEKAQPCPFYAGFGNRHTDAMSYAAVGIVPARIYIVNPESHLSLQIVTGYRSSYGKLVDLVDYVFPPLNDAIERNRSAKAEVASIETQPMQHMQKEVEVDYETYNDFYFWRQPLAQPERQQLLVSSTSDLHSASAAIDPEGTKLLDANREAEDARDGAPEDDDDDGESVERNDQYYFEKEEEAGLIPFA